MDCCGSSKPKETDKDIKSDQVGNEKKPLEKEQTHGGGCCGGGRLRYVAAFDNYDYCGFSNIVPYKEVKNLKKRTVLVIGILGILLVFGAAVALAQNTSSEKTKDAENHKCTPEMMKDMSKNCPEQMMKSGVGQKMMDGEKGHNGMMGNESPAVENTNATGENHCGDKNSDMSSMMGSSSNADVRGMM